MRHLELHSKNKRKDSSKLKYMESLMQASIVRPKNNLWLNSPKINQRFDRNQTLFRNNLWEFSTRCLEDFNSYIYLDCQSEVKYFLGDIEHENATRVVFLIFYFKTSPMLLILCSCCNCFKQSVLEGFNILFLVWTSWWYALSSLWSKGSVGRTKGLSNVLLI